MAEANPLHKPFHIKTMREGAFHSGADTVEQADIRREELNKKAESMGLKVRYEVVAKP